MYYYRSTTVRQCWSQDKNGDALEFFPNCMRSRILKARTEIMEFQNIPSMWHVLVPTESRIEIQKFLKIPPIACVLEFPELELKLRSTNRIKNSNGEYLEASITLHTF